MSSGTPGPIDTVPTPNPHAVMLKVQEVLVQSGTHEYTRADDSSEAPLAAELLGIDGIDLVLIAPRFVTLRKNPGSEWRELIPAAKQAMRDFLSSGQMAVLEKENATGQTSASEVEQQIIRLLDEEIRPAVAMDGGDINFVSFENGIVHIQMTGACGTCPSATETLKLGVERLLMEEIPEVRSVEQI